VASRIADIHLQRLFAVVLVLKVAASGLAWGLHQPWSLGFALPVALMLVYIVLGLNRGGGDVPDEKFADSCYYLGFIFTITSIIFALFDLPEIGTRLDAIAVRFGAAMTSTVLGLGVRVYLVSFERDSRDALRDAEDAVVESARRLREQLGLALDRLRDFEAEVDLAARASVERVNLRLESMSREQADRLAAWFEELAQRHQPAVDDAIADVGNASARLAAIFEGYAGGVRANLEGVDAMVGGFLEALQKRLDASIFPPDYFAKYLAAPLAQLRSASEEIAQQVRESASAVAESSGALLEASRKLRVRADSAEGAFDTLARLVQQQDLTLQGAQRHVEVVAQVAASLQGLDVVLGRAAAGVEASGQAAAALVERLRERGNRGDERATRELVAQAAERIGSRLDALVAQLEALHRERAGGPPAGGGPVALAEASSPRRARP
jgi:hypothetical protein